MTQKTSIQGWAPLLIIILVVIAIIVAIVMFGGGLPAGTGNTTGTLTGKVSIGPLCPVEPCTIPHDRLVAAYAARPITISTPEWNCCHNRDCRPGEWLLGCPEAGDVRCCYPEAGNRREPGASGNRDNPER